MGMKSTLDGLNISEKKALAHWYGTDSYKALEKLAKLEVEGLAADALKATSMEEIRRLQGRSSWAVDIFKLLRQLHKEQKQDG